jgi:hypothetical protein
MTRRESGGEGRKEGGREGGRVGREGLFSMSWKGRCEVLGT